MKPPAPTPRTIPSLSPGEAELSALEHLRLAIAGSTDLGAVQRRIAAALVGPMAFDAALVGVVDGAQATAGDWVIARARGRAVRAHLDAVALHRPGPLQAAFRRPGHASPGVLSGNEMSVVALQYRGQPIGALAVAIPAGGMSPERSRLLERFSVHAAQALAGVRLCVDRAQRLAVEAERNRISVEMHDAVIQSLFAIRQSLAGCAGLVEHGDDRAVAELDRVQALTGKTLDQLRRSIHDMWPGELLERQFITDLREHASDLAGLGAPLQLEIDVSGRLGTLSPRVRRILFRVAQESLNNVFKHARATNASIHLDASGDPVRLTVTDDGCGIDPARVESSIGIAGMRARLAALSGSLEIASTPGAGTRLVAAIPRQTACELT